MLCSYWPCFLIPKNILKIPLRNFGLFTKITFIKIPPNQILEQEKPKIITQMAKTAIKKRGGQKQLIKSPKAKFIATRPLLNLHLRISLPPDTT